MADGPDAPLLTYPKILQSLRVEFSRAQRYGGPLACLVAIVDGRERSSEAERRDRIRGVVEGIQAEVRVSDGIGLHDDRLIVLLPHTSTDGARILGQRLCAAVASREGGGTVSVGVAAVTPGGPIFYDEVLRSAQTAAEAASASGGNRLCEAPIVPPVPDDA